MKSKIIVEQPDQVNLVREVMKRTGNFIMTKLIMQRDYNIKIRLEKA